MSKIITYDFGHNQFNPNVDTGAVGYLNEDKVNVEYGSKTIKLLEQQGFTCINCTPIKSNSHSHSLKQRCDKSNQYNAVLHLCFHANAYEKDKGRGCECEYLSQNGKKCSEEILKELSKIGFINRGAKYRNNLYVLKHCKAVVCLTEPFFVTHKSDCDLYKNNTDNVALAIAKGVCNYLGIEFKSNNTQKPSQIQEKSNDTTKKTYKVNYCLEWQKFYNEQTATKKPLVLDNIYGKNTQNSLDNLLYYIKQSKKYKYCLEFQRFYNSITQTRNKITEDGYWGKQTENAYFTMVKLIKGEY